MTSRTLDPTNLAAAIFVATDGPESRYTWPRKAKLWLRCRAAGSRTWVYRADYKGGRVPVVLGTVNELTGEQALDLIEKIDAAAEHGVHPRAFLADNQKPAAAEPAAPGVLTFGLALSNYFRHLRQRLADGELRERYVEGEISDLSDDLLQRWHDLPMQGAGRIDWDLARPMFEALRARIRAATGGKKDGAAAAGKLQGALQRVWKFTRREQSGDDRVVNVFDDRPSMGSGKASNRFLNTAELAQLMPALRQLGYPYGSAMLLALCSGRRHREVSAVRWSEFSADYSEWRLPKERIKTALRTGQVEHWLPLPEFARAILRSAKEFQKQRGDVNNPFVFSVRGWQAVDSLQDGKNKLTAVKIAPWRIHDLRHTAKTLLKVLGVAEEYRDAITNHHRPGIGRDYEHGVDRAAMVDAMNKLGARLAELERGPVSAEGALAAE